MMNPLRRTPRRRAQTSRSGRSRVGGSLQRRAKPAPINSDAGSPGRLLDRILNTPHLAEVVPRLQPETFHRVILHCGLEDCAALVALATPDQLARVLDLDLWRADRPGLDEQFDAHRFGEWLEVLAESGATVAATTLAAMDADLVIAGLAQHISVFDYAAVAPYVSLDGDEVPAVRPFNESLRCEVGGYVVVGRRVDFWEAIAAVLVVLEEANHDYFTQVMHGCRRLSNSLPEVDGLHDLLTAGDQVMFELAVDREQRRDAQGYVTSAQARAFLEMSRRTDLRPGATTPGSEVARAHFRDTETHTADPITKFGRLPARDAHEAPDVAADAIVDLLHDAGILPRTARVLLERPDGHGPRLARIQAQMQFARDHNPVAHSMRSGELAFLANAIVAGSSIQARPFLAEEASKAAVAVCNLGLENWPVQWLAVETPHRPFRAEAGTVLPDDFLVRHDLVSVFQVGWTILHENVCMYAAERLIEVLTSLHCDDRTTQAALTTLRITMTKHWRAGTPWSARDALDAIAILDMPTWAALLGLIDEFPVLHGAVVASLSGDTRAISASAFDFFSENSQIVSVRDFLRSLPERLRG